jgi:hypothetical protein
MIKQALFSILPAFVFCIPGAALADIEGNTSYKLDLTNAQEAAWKAKWSNPDLLTVTTEGLGWGSDADKGSREVWLQTEPMGIGLSWRPTTTATIKATVNHPVSDGLLYARYSSDGKNWTNWQYLEPADKPANNGLKKAFQGTLRVPYREGAPYQALRMKYARREDVPWCSDEEALALEICKGEPEFFKKATPFIGYVQFLYEGQFEGGQRMKGMQVEVSWEVGGKHQRPKDENTSRGRDGVWRFKAP